MRLQGVLVVLAVWFSFPAFARLEPSICGTHPLKLKEEMFLHRQAVRKRPVARAAASPSPRAVTSDSGNITVLDAGGGALVTRNQFDLDSRTLSFLPIGSNASSYRFELGEFSYDSAAADA